MAYLPTIKHAMAVLGTMLLVACGGSGGGTPADITYSGKTSQAVLTADNDDAFGTIMLEGSASTKSRLQRF